MKTNIIAWIALGLGVLALAFSATQFFNPSAGTVVKMPLQVISTGGTGGSGGNCPPGEVEICGFGPGVGFEDDICVCGFRSN